MAILDHRSVRSVAIGCSAAALLVLLLTGVVFSGVAGAQPALSVTKSGGKVLLGGEATVRITVTNTGNERGFNLEITDTFTSIPLKPDDTNKAVEFVSAATPDGPLTPTSVTTDPITNALKVRFDSIRDLMPTESVTIDLVVRTTDLEWAVGDLLHDEAVARVNTRADGGGDWIDGSASADIEVIPIRMVTKTANQSTAARQATGCGELPAGGWPFSYTLEVRNNEVNTTNIVAVTDVVPDGVEYLGILAGSPPTTVSRDNATGRTTLTWKIGDMAPGATWTVRYSAGIRYDYFGTDNGGTNRPYNDYSGTPALGAPVPDGTSFRNTADLSAEYLGDPVSDSASARVTAAYLTIAKSVDPTTSGNGGTVHFTITYTAS